MKLPQLTEKEFTNRYSNAPDEIRDTLDSEEARKSLLNLCRTHYLSAQKATALEQLVGFVLLGLIAPRDLAREIGEHLYLNHEHARVLANEVNTRIFEPILEELENFYNPLEEAENEEKNNEEGVKIEAEVVGAPTETPVSVELKEGSPLILHEEASFFKDKRPGPKKSFFPFFATSPESAESIPSIRVKVETPPEKKVIDYSESRSPFSPLGPSPEEFISIEALEKMRSTPPEAELPHTEPKPITQTPADTFVPFTIPIVKTKDIPQTVPPQPPIATPEKKGFSWPLKLFKRKEKEETPSPSPEKIEEPIKNAPETFSISLDVPSSEHKQPEIEGNVVHLK